VKGHLFPAHPTILAPIGLWIDLLDLWPVGGAPVGI